jgi:MFS family permease
MPMTCMSPLARIRLGEADARAEVDIVSFLCAREFGVSVYGRAYGVIYSATLVAAGAGPFAFGLLADRGGYELALFASAGAVLLSAVLFSCIRAHRSAA